MNDDFLGRATVHRARVGLNMHAVVNLLAARFLLRQRIGADIDQGTDLSGNSLPFAPKLTAQAGFDWTMLELGGGKVTFSPNVAYSSRQFFSPFNDENAVGSPQVNSELMQGANAKVNATLGWSNGSFGVRLFANNLFNRKTYAYGLDLRGAGFPYNFLIPAAPRTYGLSVRAGF